MSNVGVTPAMRMMTRTTSLLAINALCLIVRWWKTCGVSIELVKALVIIMTELQKRIKYFQSLAANLPNDLEDRDLLYQKYMEHIEKIRQEEQDDD